jgi:hypothetical protein
MVGEQKEATSDGIDQTVGNLDARAFGDDVIPDSSKSTIARRATRCAIGVTIFAQRSGVQLRAALLLWQGPA